MQLRLQGWLALKTKWIERDPLLTNLDENGRQCWGSVVAKTGIVFKSQFPDFSNPPFGLDYTTRIRFIKSASFANETFQRLHSFSPVSMFDGSYMINLTKSYKIFWLSTVDYVWTRDKHFSWSCSKFFFSPSKLVFKIHVQANDFSIKKFESNLQPFW